MYIRHDITNTPDVVQPTSSTVTLYSGTEGYPEIQYEIWNGDYIPHDISNSPVTKSSYQKRDINNQIVTPSSYQRHDLNNQPILQ